MPRFSRGFDVQQAHDWLLRLQRAPVTQADADAFRRWRALDPR
ncbi:MAG TPA: iron dicitrate transport regulator FecR, partial [Stenotrophomonas sp.]|nr:iron dicitrate transport regulator FecR [Stenotrophomonas sp.]